MVQAVLINGNNKRASRLTGIHEYIENYLEVAGISAESIYIHELPADDLITANFSSEEIAIANKKVTDAEIVFILTPIFKASYTGILKTYLDLIPQKGLENKTIVPIAIGGSIGHLLAVEYSLKPVLSVLGATEILNTVFVLDQQVERLGSGEYKIQDVVLNRLNNELQKIESYKIKQIN
ncbi:NADPH-dependent FMN reductase [Lysinibacillus sp. SGAir0095]|uniref:NADPH-dependent FMN reductase n=1 Tax=Lysinibacillus sp. SGAir0095 TaxID=2070463 RepID=UPI0010CD0B4C|nr:NADPH-dependent FMN reductase [Lysinibacillus sp. SGAir0095]QCR33381.1 FMN reductase (NADPH) [Lysinibacillus sp. SGAir0095]